MADPHADDVARLLAGELSPTEQRRLAQRALDDLDLLDTLTAAAVADAALASEREAAYPRDRQTDRGSSPPAVGRRRWPQSVALGSAAALAAGLLLAVAYTRTSTPSMPPTSAAATAPTLHAIPQPILLTARAETSPNQTFRSQEVRSRDPKPVGIVTAVYGVDVDVDLGALDGLRQGSVLRAPDAAGGATEPARVTITTVFRERSRGKTSRADAVRVGDRLEVPSAAHVQAILDEAAARQSTSDEGGVDALLELAVSVARRPDVPVAVRRQALEQLAASKRRSGDLSDAARLLTSAAGEFDAPPVAGSSERAVLLNELGTIQIEQRNLPAAEQALRAAESSAAGIVAMRVKNNLGALAALRGDRAAAAALYRQAQSLAGDTPELAADRVAIEKNLASVEGR